MDADDDACVPLLLTTLDEDALMALLLVPCALDEEPALDVAPLPLSPVLLDEELTAEPDELDELDSPVLVGAHAASGARQAAMRMGRNDMVTSQARHRAHAHEYHPRPSRARFRRPVQGGSAPGHA